jgi:hypothetical protein
MRMSAAMRFQLGLGQAAMRRRAAFPRQAVAGVAHASRYAEQYALDRRAEGLALL